MLEKYGLSNDDIKHLGLFDAIVFLTIKEGYKTEFEILTVLAEMVKENLSSIFIHPEKIDYEKEVKNSLSKLVELGFITGEGELTELGEKLLKFLVNETNIPEYLKKLPRVEKEKMKEESKPRVVIDEDEIRVFKKTPNGLDTVIFTAPKEALEYYFTTHPKEFMKFVEFLKGFLKKQIGLEEDL